MTPWVKSRKGQLLLGLISGIGFGFLLQKGQVTNYGVIMGTFLFTDLTVVKVMFSAVVIGAIGIHFLKGKGLVELRIREAALGRNIIGGIIFGIGFGLLGARVANNPLSTSSKKGRHNREYPSDL